jgi:hypothetical protein
MYWYLRLMQFFGFASGVFFFLASPLSPHEENKQKPGAGAGRWSLVVSFRVPAVVFPCPYLGYCVCSLSHCCRPKQWPLKQSYFASSFFEISSNWPDLLDHVQRIWKLNKLFPYYLMISTSYLANFRCVHKSMNNKQNLKWTQPRVQPAKSPICSLFWSILL